MRKFLSILRIESKRYLSIIILTSLIFIITCYLFLQFGINEYQKSIKESSSFIELEDRKVSEIQNTALYTIIGYKKKGISNSLFSLFYNSTKFTVLNSFKDAGYRLEINKPEMGANAFDQPLGKSSMDYNWLYLFFGSAAFMVLGFVTYHKKQDYVKFLLGFASYRTVYAAVLVSKILIIMGFLVAGFLAVIFQFHVFNGIRLSGLEIHHLAVFFFVPCFILFAVSLFLGMLFGTFKNTFKGVSFSLLTWFLLIIFIPEIFNVTLAKNTKSMFDSIYQHELKKLEIFSQAEKSVFEEVSKYNTPEEIKGAYKRMMQQYLDGDFKKIVALEKKMLDNTIKAARKVHFYSIFTPVTFYKSVGNEISGYSYNGLIDFYRANIIQYEKFVEYCLKNTMIRMRPKENPFIKNPEDYVIHLESSLPKFFGVGVLYNLLVLIGLAGVSYCRFKRFIFPKHKVAGAFGGLAYNFDSGGYFAFQYKKNDSGFPDQVYNVLMGRTGSFSGKISIDGKDIVTEPGKQDFIYLPCPDKIPVNLKIKSLINMFTAFFEIPADEIDELKEKFPGKWNTNYETLGNIKKTELLLKLALLSKKKIIVMNNLFSQVTQTTPMRQSCREMIESTGLKNKSNIVIEFASLNVLIHSYFDYYYGVGFSVSSNVYTDDILQDNR